MEPKMFIEDHVLAKWHLTPKPKEYDLPVRNIRTVLKKPVNDNVEVIQHMGKWAIKLEIKFMASIILNLKHPLANLEINSKFIFEALEQEPGDEYWCGLTMKTLERFKELYKERVAATYLTKTELDIPKTIKDDCLKQRKLDKASRGN